MARKTVLVSDMSGVEIPDGKGATIRISFRDARKGVRELDVTDAEAERLGGRQGKRRGGRPKDANGNKKSATKGGRTMAAKREKKRSGTEKAATPGIPT